MKLRGRPHEPFAVDRGIARDPEQPRTRVFQLAETLPFAQGPDENIVQHVIGGGAVAQASHQKAAQFALMGMPCTEHAIECRRILPVRNRICIFARFFLHPFAVSFVIPGKWNTRKRISMLETFTLFADWLTHAVLGLDPSSRLGQAVHFFVEDTSKILVLLMVMIYVIGLARASLDLERVRAFLQRKHRFAGYLFGSAFGAITPFCSCSSIPLFLGFTSAGIPIGVTMAFLLTSPVINEVAVVLLWSLLGWKFTLAYIVVGMSVGILGGLLLDRLRAEQWLQDFAARAYRQAGGHSDATPQAQPTPGTMTFAERHEFAKNETLEIAGRIWKWVLIGIGIGAALHGFMPEGWFERQFGTGQWWSVPAAVLAGLPLYSNATGVIPVLESLLGKGLPLGTTLAFCMSVVAASIPEFLLLKQVMLWRLLALLFVILLASFMLVGWIFNAIAPWLDIV